MRGLRVGGGLPVGFGVGSVPDPERACRDSSVAVSELSWVGHETIWVDLTRSQIAYEATGANLSGHNRLFVTNKTA